jgi:hypothetical protein
MYFNFIGQRYFTIAPFRYAKWCYRLSQSIFQKHEFPMVISETKPKVKCTLFEPDTGTSRRTQGHS